MVVLVVVVVVVVVVVAVAAFGSVVMVVRGRHAWHTILDFH